MRRMFRRHIRKTLAQEVPPILQEANFAFDKGEYGRAGELFERIAETAAARNTARAPIYYLKAGQARALAGQIKLAMPSLKRGLELLAQRGAVEKYRRAGRHAVSELLEHGFPTESQELQAFLDHHSSQEASPDSFSATSAKKPLLPTHCPSCGAAVRPDEVEWVDESAAECAYCGNPLR